jgi:hypothetical protein
MDRGGWLVTYDSLAEQQTVEYTFKGSSASWPTTECAPLLARHGAAPVTRCEPAAWTLLAHALPAALLAVSSFAMSLIGHVVLQCRQ